MEVTADGKLTPTFIERLAEEQAPGMSAEMFCKLLKMAKRKGMPVPIFASGSTGEYGGQWMHPDGTIRKSNGQPTHTEEYTMNPYVTMMIGFGLGISMTVLGFILADPCNWIG